MKVLIGSKNPVKIRGAKKAFSQFFPKVEAQGLSVLSRVSSQPRGEELFTGAENRARAIELINRGRSLEGEYFVGIESGLVEQNSLWFISAVVCIRNSEGKMAYGTTPQFQLPDFFADKVLAGMELSEMIDRFSGEKNSGRKGGAIGFLSKGILKRVDLYSQGVMTALVPFISKELYFESEEI